MEWWRPWPNNTSWSIIQDVSVVIWSHHKDFCDTQNLPLHLLLLFDFFPVMLLYIRGSPYAHMVDMCIRQSYPLIEAMPSNSFLPSKFKATIEDPEENEWEMVDHFSVALTRVVGWRMQLGLEKKDGRRHEGMFLSLPPNPLSRPLQCNAGVESQALSAIDRVTPPQGETDETVKKIHDAQRQYVKEC